MFSAMHVERSQDIPEILFPLPIWRHSASTLRNSSSNKRPDSQVKNKADFIVLSIEVSDQEVERVDLRQRLLKRTLELFSTKQIIWVGCRFTAFETKDFRSRKHECVITRVDDAIIFSKTLQFKYFQPGYTRIMIQSIKKRHMRADDHIALLKDETSYHLKHKPKLARRLSHEIFYQLSCNSSLLQAPERLPTWLLRRELRRDSSIDVLSFSCHYLRLISSSTMVFTIFFPQFE
jgi:hypothetical protein